MCPLKKKWLCLTFYLGMAVWDRQSDPNMGGKRGLSNTAESGVLSNVWIVLTKKETKAIIPIDGFAPL